MRTDILQFCLNQLSAIILFTVFCVCGIRLRRFSAKATLLAAAAAFSVIQLPQIMFPSFFLLSAETPPENISMHIIYWGLSICAQYLVLFALTKREWLRTLFFYSVWDALTSIILSVLMAGTQQVFSACSPETQAVGSFMLSAAAAALSIWILQIPAVNRLRFPAWIYTLTVLLYSGVRFFSTILLYSAEDEKTAAASSYTALFFSIFLLLFTAAAYFCMTAFIKKRCTELEDALHTSAAPEGLSYVLHGLRAECRRRHVRLRTQTALPEQSVLSDGSILFAAVLIFHILLDGSGRTSAPENISPEIRFTAQEKKGFLIFSASMLVPDPSAVRRAPFPDFAASVRCSLREILLNSILRRCHGRIQYLDSDLAVRHLRVIIPLPA